MDDNAMRYVVYVVFLIFAGGCVEPIDFTLENKKLGLVVDGYISDVSFTESKDYPSAGRFFQIELSYTGDITNIAGEKADGALISLETSNNRCYDYTGLGEGIYQLEDEGFKAIPGISYRLRIALEGSSFTSNWETLPAAEVPMSRLTYAEKEKEFLVYEAGEPVVDSKQIVNVYAEVPPNNEGNPRYLLWTFKPHWVYTAPLAAFRSAVRTCWVTDDLFLNHYTLQIDYNGGYDNELFFFQTIRNERIYDELTVLVRQFSISADYYYFLEDLKKQAAMGQLFDAPPYSASTNLAPEGTGDLAIYGFFGVVHEEAERWYFTKEQLSYGVKAENLDDCLADLAEFGPDPPDCFSCLEYPGTVTNLKPEWWR